MLETLCPVVSSLSCFHNVKLSIGKNEDFSLSQRQLKAIEVNSCHDEIYNSLSSCTEDEPLDEIITDNFSQLVFYNMQFYLDENGLCLDRKVYKQLMEKVIENGGKCSKYVNRNVSFFITGHGPLRSKLSVLSQKQKAASQLNIPLVTIDFIYCCVKEGKLLNSDSFLLLNSSKSEGFQLGEITLVKKNEKPKLSYHSFQNVPAHEYFPEDLTNFTLLKYVQLKGKTVIGNARDPSINYQFFILEMHACLKDDYDIPSNYCIFSHEGEIKHPEKGKKLCRYVSTLDGALNIYATFLKQLSGAPKYLLYTQEYLSDSLGTPSFQQIQREVHANSIPLEPSVIYTVDILWNETKQSIEKVLAADPLQIPAWKIKEAKKVVTQIGFLLKKGNHDSIARLAEEFYNIINFRKENRERLSTFLILNDKYKLIEKLQDLIKLKEFYPLDIVHNPEARCRALRCNITMVSEDTDDYENIANLVLNNQTENTNIKIRNIFKISRNAETVLFRDSLGNKKHLFHGTAPDNLMGVISRGLQVENLIGTELTSKGQSHNLLGPGIYFTDSTSYCTKYCKPNAISGTRMVLVCEVSLGKVYRTLQSDPKMTSPPPGYDSVLGEKNESGSDFHENEYVIFDQYQNKLQYLVEYSLPEDLTLSISSSIENTVNISGVTDNVIKYSFDISNFINVDPEPAADIAQGLECVNTFHNIYLLLKSIHIKAQVVDLVAKVYLFQEYENVSEKQLEVRYIFPLDKGAAICGFEAFIGAKHIIGEVKDKETAREEYETAKKEGHGAYLLEGTAENVFSIQIGNLPPKTRAIIKITFIAELNIENDLVEFIMPSLSQKVIFVERESHINPNFSFEASIEMAREIISISSPSHQVVSKKTDTKAVVKLLPTGENTLSDLKLYIRVNEIHIPRMWIEKHPDRDTRACMVTFYPKFNLEGESFNSTTRNTIIFLLDTSDSMKSDDFQNLLYIVLLSLELMKPNTLFNIVAYGTMHRELFSEAQPFSLENHIKAKRFLSYLLPNMGKSQLSQTIRSYQLLLINKKNDVFLITNGIRNEESDILKLNLNKIRVFSFGLGNSTEHHLLSLLALKTGGSHNSFSSMEKGKWKHQISRILEKSRQPSLINIEIEWQNENNVMQAPLKLYSIFNGSSQIVYALDTFCLMATLKAKIEEQEVSTIVASYELSQTTGTMLHSLAARAYVKDWENGILNENEIMQLVSKEEQKEIITKLAKQYSLVTSLTSFVAVEKRSDPNESFTDINIESLLVKVNVDILNYMEFSVNEEKKLAPCEEPNFMSLEECDLLDYEDSPDYEPTCLGGSLSYNEERFEAQKCSQPLVAKSRISQEEDYGFGNNPEVDMHLDMLVTDNIFKKNFPKLGQTNAKIEKCIKSELKSRNISKKAQTTDPVAKELSDHIIHSSRFRRLGKKLPLGMSAPTPPPPQSCLGNVSLPILSCLGEEPIEEINLVKRTEVLVKCLKSSINPSPPTSSGFTSESAHPIDNMNKSTLPSSSGFAFGSSFHTDNTSNPNANKPTLPSATGFTFGFPSLIAGMNKVTLPSSTGITFGSSCPIDNKNKPTLPNSTGVTFGSPDSTNKPTLPRSTQLKFGYSYPIDNTNKPTLPSSTGFTFGSPSPIATMNKSTLPSSTGFPLGCIVPTGNTIETTLPSVDTFSLAPSLATFNSTTSRTYGFGSSVAVTQNQELPKFRSAPFSIQNEAVVSKVLERKQSLNCLDEKAECSSKLFFMEAPPVSFSSKLQKSAGQFLLDQSTTELLTTSDLLVGGNEISGLTLKKKKKKKIAVEKLGTQEIAREIQINPYHSMSTTYTADGTTSGTKIRAATPENSFTSCVMEILSNYKSEINFALVMTEKSLATTDFNKGIMFMENNLQTRGGSFPIISSLLDCFSKDLRKQEKTLEDFYYLGDSKNPRKKFKTTNIPDSLFKNFTDSIISMEIELRNNGLISLGANIVETVLKMLVEVSLLEINLLYLLVNFSWDNPEMLMELDSSFLLVLKSLSIMLQNNDIIVSTEFVTSAIDNVNVFDKKYPLLYSVLTREKSWERFIFSQLKKTLNKLI